MITLKEAVKLIDMREDTLVLLELDRKAKDLPAAWLPESMYFSKHDIAKRIDMRNTMVTKIDTNFVCNECSGMVLTIRPGIKGRQDWIVLANLFELQRSGGVPVLRTIVRKKDPKPANENNPLYKPNPLKNNEKHMVWDNDVCAAFESLKEEHGDEVPEDELWEDARDEIERSLDDETANLDIDLDRDIIMVGTMERWDKPRKAYKNTGIRNIGQAVRESTGYFGGIENSFEIYVVNNRLMLSQTGHDNPTNPSVFEFRVLTRDFDDLPDDLPDTLISNSRPLGPMVREVYGW